MTQIALPLEISKSSEDSTDDVAFKVLNQDNLPMTVVGEPIFKPFGLENQKQKPNGIVFPTRRITTNLNENRQKQFAQSTQNFTENSQHRNNLKNNLSQSHGNLHHNNSSVKLISEDFNTQQLKFTKLLDAKLRKLYKEEKSKKSNESSPTNNNHNKKPFITTVKTGVFLDPPPPEQVVPVARSKVESVLKHEKLYAYASQPRVLNRNTLKAEHASHCEAAAIAAAALGHDVASIHATAEEIDMDDNKNPLEVPPPYANLMFERRVARGSNFATNNCVPHQGDGESAAARAAEARRRAMARKKARNQQIRASQLRIGSPPAILGRKHEPVQTEKYLEEIWTNPPVADICTQTDLFLERPISPFYVPAKTGQDVATQIYPGDLFDFDMEVQPILEVLVGKTVEQALIEVLEEEELAALREQQRRFMELRAAETCEAQRIEEREKRLLREKQRRMEDHARGLEIQKEMEERIAASVLMQGYMADLLPSVLEGLESEGYLMDSIKQDIDDSFMPWLMKEVSDELHDVITSRDVLTDIVREILENRAEIYEALNREIESDHEEEDGFPFSNLQPMKLVFEDTGSTRPPKSPAESTEKKPT